jgi:hypothetical protein
MCVGVCIRVCPPTTFCVCLCCRGNVFTEIFLSNRSLFCLQYSSFQASCNTESKSCWTRCFLCGPYRIKYSIFSEMSVGDYFFPELRVYFITYDRDPYFKIYNKDNFLSLSCLWGCPQVAKTCKAIHLIWSILLNLLHRVAYYSTNIKDYILCWEV